MVPYSLEFPSIMDIYSAFTSIWSSLGLGNYIVGMLIITTALRVLSAVMRVSPDWQDPTPSKQVESTEPDPSKYVWHVQNKQVRQFRPIQSCSWCGVARTDEVEVYPSCPKCGGKNDEFEYRLVTKKVGAYVLRESLPHE